METKIENTLLLCLGTVIGRDNKKRVGFEIVGGDYDGRTMAFKPSRRKELPGCLYKTTLTIEEDGRLGGYSGGLIFDGPLNDEERYAKVKLDSRLAEDFFVMESQAKKFDIDELCPGFDRLRQAYQRTNAQGRAALAARVIDELRKW